MAAVGVFPGTDFQIREILLQDEDPVIGTGAVVVRYRRSREIPTSDNQYEEYEGPCKFPGEELLATVS